MAESNDAQSTQTTASTLPWWLRLRFQYESKDPRLNHDLRLPLPYLDNSNTCSPYNVANANATNARPSSAGLDWRLQQ